MIETMGKPDKDLNEVMKHICDVMRKRINEAYKRGVNDGSLDVKQRAEGAYQKGLEDGKAQDSHGCEGCEWDGTPFDVCSKCRNSYGNLYKRKEPDDEIKVGDEVVWTEDEDVVIIVTLIYTSSGIEWCDGICRDGKAYQILTEHARKTSRHFDIDKILEAMKA